MGKFSPAAVVKEIKKIRWPEKKNLLTSSVQVVLFTAFFALFFYGCQFIVSLALRAMGVIN